MAMNATKRKFNALLQGLGHSQPTPASAHGKPDDAMRSATSGNTSSDDLLKRRRLGLAGSLLAPQEVSPSRPAAGLREASKKPDALAQVKDRREPLTKYCPSDREELLRRLSTFQEITDWTPKPDKVNEVEWAKRGWVCQGKERVRCVLCNRELVVKLNRKDLTNDNEVAEHGSSEIENALVDKYAELMTISHQEDCLWRKRGSDDSLLRLSLANSQVALEAMRQRYHELLERKPFLPYEFNLRLPEGLQLDHVLQKLPQDFLTQSRAGQGSPDSSDQPVNRVALALALLGWQGLSNVRIGAVPNSASCQTCMRRLGLWMFKSKEVDDGGQVIVPAPMDYLDPVREHRFFCPWKNPEAQSRGGVTSDKQGPLPGWIVFLQTLDNDAHLRNVLEGRSPSRPQHSRGHSANRKSWAPPDHARNEAVGGDSNDAVSTQSQSVLGEDGEDEKEREAKDKERWARLRRVKSLFEAKGSRRLKRPLSQNNGHSATTGVDTIEQVQQTDAADSEKILRPA